MHLHHNNVFISRATAFLWLIKNVIFKELFPPQKNPKNASKGTGFFGKENLVGGKFWRKNLS